VLLTKWTIRLALACFVAYLGGWLVADSPRWQRASRWIWTVGCGLFLVHVACAFHFYHHWSHAVAWEETARQTEELMGVAFGDGIYFSYLFLVLWVVDVAGLWLMDRRAEGKGKPRPLVAALRGSVIAFLAFIAFNGSIIFEGGPTRWFGIAACVVLAGLVIRRGYNCVLRQPDTATPAEVRAAGAECGVQIAE
jgi:hypothetical protein